MARFSISRISPGVVAALFLLGACAPDSPVPTSAKRDAQVSLARAGYDQAGVHRQYGPPVKVGNGMARAYVVVDSKNEQAPLELGIALDASALEGLPSSEMMYMYLLKLPALAPEPYKLVELDWNPHGHEPPGVYTVPHFDFHFYTITLAERNAIVPGNPNFAAEANNLPTGAYVPPFYAALAGPGQSPADIAVPMMGVHWSDVRSPELQGLLGHPENYQPFTKTFIYGSWNGRFTFYEPMVTLAYLQSNPDFSSDIPVPQLYPEPGYFPTSYKVTYDAQAKEYRVALTGLTWRQ
jgi:hypothetical protein